MITYRPRGVCPLAPFFWSALLLSAALVRSGVPGTRAPASARRPASAATEAAVQQLKREGTYGSLLAAVCGAGYAVRRALHTEGAYSAGNAAQGFETRFADGGVEVTPRAPSNASSPLRLHFNSWSRAGKRQTSGDARSVSRGSRLEYRRAGLTEWYENGERGLEQGFTIQGVQALRRPGLRAGSRAYPRLSARTPTLPHTHTPTRSLTLRLSVEGAYRVRIALDGQSAAFEPVHGGATLTYSGLKSWDARGKALATSVSGDEQSLELQVADAGAAYPVTIDPLLTTVTKVTASDGAVDDWFGQSLALSGNTALVGAPGKNGQAGAAYVFCRSDSGWSEQTTLTAADAAANDHFGTSVALSGETALVGATNLNTGAEAVYVFVGSGAAWSQQQKLTASDAAAIGEFGASVALSGETALVGAPSKSGSRGAGYVFTRTGTTWTQQAKLTASDAAAVDNLGGSVALSGDTALLGAYRKNANAGAAYVFVRSGSLWTQQQKLTASDAAADHYFGQSVALSGDTALVGAPVQNFNTGAAYVFIRAGAAWSQQQKLLAAGGVALDRFGVSVALSGETALVGANGGNGGTGAAYAFTRAGAAWSQQAALAPADGAASDYFGYSVALSGNLALAGAFLADTEGGTDAGAAYLHNLVTGSTQLLASDGGPFEKFGISVALSGSTALVGANTKNGVRGAAYVFVRSGVSWSQQQELTAAADAAPNDEFGISVALSGNTALVGARGKNSFTGAAYVFARSGSVWSQQQKLTAADAAAGDYFGQSLALSGNTALVGATGGNGHTGSVYVFVRSGSAWSQQQELTAADAAGNDNFGFSVALSGNTALVGAWQKNNATGAAYVFLQRGGVWSQQQELTAAADAELGDFFGCSVALSGETALVGAFGKDGDTGAAYVFVRSGTIWSPQATISAVSLAAGDSFGSSVALSGDTALLGAWRTKSETGAAYLFVRSGGVWTQQGELAAADGGLANYFAQQVALSADTALAGALRRDVYTGAAYTFELKPYAPLALAARAVSQGRVDLSWTDISGIESGFEIQRSAAGGFWSLVDLEPEDAIQARDTGVQPATLYRYRIRAVDAAGSGDWTGPVTVTTPGGGGAGSPAAPSNLAALAAAPDQVALSWTDNASDEDEFEIQRQVGSGPWAPAGVVGPGITSTLDVGLAPGATYHYRVRAGNVNGDSSWSNTASVTLASGLPTAPTGLTGTVLSPTQVRINWTDATGETGYELQRSPNNTLWSTIGTLAANLVTATDGTALPNTTYFYRVRAVNSFGGVTSGAVSVSTPGTPPAPTGLVLTALSATRVRIDWTDNSATESGFEIDRSLNRTLWSTIGAVSANVISAIDESAEPDTLYWYRVRSVNGYGSSNSISISVTTPDGLPAAPSALTAAAVSPSQINLTWTDNSGNETSFEVQARGNGGASSEPWLTIGTMDANATKSADLGLNPSTSYSYRVRAVDGYGASAWSNVSTAATPAAGSAGMHLSAALKGAQIRLRWSGKASGTRQYAVERKGGKAQGAGRFAAVGKVSGSTKAWIDRHVSGGVTYTYRLRRDGAGKEAFSNMATARAR